MCANLTINLIQTLGIWNGIVAFIVHTPRGDYEWSGSWIHEGNVHSIDQPRQQDRRSIQ